MFLPIWLAEFIAKRMEKRAAKSGEMPMMTTFSVYNLKRNNRFDYSKAVKVLGYKVRPIEQTLMDEANWLRDNGFI
jgi:dihydroflavonol-4-reductase